MLRSRSMLSSCKASIESYVGAKGHPAIWECYGLVIRHDYTLLSVVED
jgi:hypothetical protein